MADPAAPAAPASISAASAAAPPVAAPPAKLKFGAPPAAAPAATPPATEPKVEPKDPPAAAAPDAELIKQLTKSSAAERKANNVIAQLKKDLEAATGSSTKHQQEAAILEAIKKDPSEVLKLGITWDDLLASIAGKKKEPEDPRHEATKAELAKLQARIDAKEKADEDAKTTAAQAEFQASVKRGHANVSAVLEKDGASVDAEGYPRWAIVSQDPASVVTVYDQVVEHIDENKLSPTTEEITEWIRQGFDQLEAHERARVAPLLKAAATKSVGDTSADRTSQPKSHPRETAIRERYTIDDSTRGAPPPAGMNKKPDGPRTRARF